MISPPLPNPHARWGKWLALAMGLSAFFLVVGPMALMPTNLDWIYGIDPSQHYLGWAMYRYGPWTMPIGLNPSYGLEISSSIVFSDSIPLMAILLKPFSSWLPDPFQYLGIWVLLCFILQAYFAFLLASLFTSRLLLKVLFMGLLVFAPPMLWRIGLHAALVAHFVILAAFFLAFSKNHQKRFGLWIALLMITALIHVYLLLMVLCIWFGSFLDQLWVEKSKSYQQAAKELVFTALMLWVCLWQAGYFALSVHAAATPDLYGAWGLNLLTFLDPQNWSYLQWLRPQVRSNGESFFYFGLGIFLLALVMIFNIGKNASWIADGIKHHRFLVLGLLILLLFAISNQVVIGTWSFSYPLPEIWVEQYASIFRLSARLAWPIWYVLVVMILVGIIKQLSYSQACAIMMLALVILVVDLSSGYLPLRERHQATQDLRFGLPTQSNFWQKAAQHYSAVRFFPLRTNPLPQPYWYTLSSYSAKHQLATNAVYLSRLDGRKVEQANSQFLGQLHQEDLAANTLYIFGHNNVANIYPFVNRQKDYFAVMDDHLVVLAPQWKSCTHCDLDDAEKKIEDLLLLPKLGERVVFAQGYRAVGILGWGWEQPELWGVWAQDRVALITMRSPAAANSILLEWNALVSPSHPQQRIIVRVVGSKGNPQEFTFTQARNNEMNIAVPNHLRGSDVQLEFTFLDRVRPKTLDMGEDTRELSVGLLAATFY